jgi:hypothetical protein
MVPVTAWCGGGSPNYDGFCLVPIGSHWSPGKLPFFHFKDVHLLILFFWGKK